MRTNPLRLRWNSTSNPNSFVQIRQLLIVAIFSFSVLGLVAYPIPSNKPTYYPSWWFTRGGIVPTNPTNSAPNWPTDYPTPNDYTAINEGQLKNFATQAYNELHADAPGSVWSTSQGTNLASMVAGWSPSSGDNYQEINLGQLKAVVKPFYDVLAQAGYANGYPWTGVGADDYSAANIGQLKNVFNFSIATPPAPTNLTVVFGGTQATLTWLESIFSVQSFEIQYSTDGGVTWSNLTSVAGNTTSITVTGLTLGTNYIFRIVASNASGSATSTNDTTPIITLIAPTGATLVP